MPDRSDTKSAPLPANLPAKAVPAFHALMRGLAEEKALEQQLADLQKVLQKQRDQVLNALCPVKDGDFLPVDRNVMLQVYQRTLMGSLGDDNSETPETLRWRVKGTRYTYKNGVEARGIYTSIDQLEYDALSDVVKAQTRETLVAQNTLMIELDKPLRITDSMKAMFQHLSSRFDNSKTATVNLPSVTWSSTSETERIYLSMVKQGVITFAKNSSGKMTDANTRLDNWYVTKGPRYEAFATALQERHEAKVSARLAANTDGEAAPAARRRGPR